MSEREQAMKFPDHRHKARMQRLRYRRTADDRKDEPTNEQRPYEYVRVFRGPCRAT